MKETHIIMIAQLYHDNCPFCGASAHAIWIENIERTDKFFSRCTKCKTPGLIQFSVGSAVESWMAAINDAKLKRDARIQMLQEALADDAEPDNANID